MKIQVNTDNHIAGREALVEEVEAVVEAALRHVRGRITRVEVHLNDENSSKGGGNDKRCVMEARIEGLAPVAVSHHGDSLGAVMAGAADKLKAALATTLGRRSSVRAKAPVPADSPDQPPG